MKKGDEITPVNSFEGGLADFNKSGKKGTFSQLRSVNYRDNPTEITVQPQALKESGSTIQALPKWIERVSKPNQGSPLNVNLLPNTSLEPNATGWTFDAGFTRSNGAAYEGTYSIQQNSSSGYNGAYTTVGSEIDCEPQTNYKLTFFAKVDITGSNLPPIAQLNGGSAFGEVLLPGLYHYMEDTNGEWVQQTLIVNSRSNTKLAVRIFNNNGQVLAYYDAFSLVKIGNSATYFYDEVGALYLRDAQGTYTKLRDVSNSHGNGLKYYPEDDFLYYIRDTTIGRYGPTSSGAANYSDDFLASFGGVASNSASLLTDSASSQYAKRASSASLQLSTALTLEAYRRFESLPTVGNTMALLSKWDESGATRSYKMDILAISGYFGDGSAGNLIVSSDTTDAPTDAPCAGTIDTYTLYATNGAFTAGQKIYIHQTQGAGAGTYQKTTIQSYAAGVITTTDKLNFSYNSSGNNRAQVIVRKQYGALTINAGVNLYVKAWNGTTGGIFPHMAQSLSGTGIINGLARGFRGGSGTRRTQGTGYTGESYSGLGTNIPTDTMPYGQSSPRNAGGGQGGGRNNIGSSSGGGAGHANPGSGATDDSTHGGDQYGVASLVTAHLGSGGGGGGKWESDDPAQAGGLGGNGGGLIDFSAPTMSAVQFNVDGGNGIGNAGGMGAGAGSGGSVRLQLQTGNPVVYARGGTGSSGNYSTGGNGSDGRVHVDYLTSYTGTGLPAADTTQDSTLVTSTSYQLRLSLSGDGTLVETISKNVDLAVNTWVRLAISWSVGTATFYKDGVSLGSVATTTSSINANASEFSMNAYKNATVYTGFFDGLSDDDRVWNVVRTLSQVNAYKDYELADTEPGLVGYWKYNNALTDASASANHLTGQNAPTYSPTVAFSNASARLDVDQSRASTGNTYTLGTTIDESTNNARIEFIPKKDPQKSFEVSISDKGTGNWTVTIHDPANNLIASKTVVNSVLPSSGRYEFVFDSVWTPVLNATYHAHLTSTVTDGIVVTQTAGNLDTATYKTYYQFLVKDTDFHTAELVSNGLGICNGRYLAYYESGVYNPHRLIFPAIYRTRCIAKWNEFWAIGCIRGNSFDEYDEGIIFFWDGSSPRYNHFINVPEGGVNAMFGSQGVLTIVAGYKGDILEYRGGDSARKVKRIPGWTPESAMQVYPQAITMWQTLLRIGVGQSDSTSIQKGVYTYGQSTESWPVSLSFDFPISTGSLLSSVTVGALIPHEKGMLIGWKDGTVSGVDKIDLTNPPYPTAYLQGTIEDEGGVYKEKVVNVVRADFLPLRENESVTIKYRMDRVDEWTTADTKNSPGDTIARMEITTSNDRHREFEWAIDIGCGATSPTLLEVATKKDLRLAEESQP